MEIEKALYMIPVPISEGEIKNMVPEYNVEIIRNIKHFIVENIRTARRFLKKMCPDIDISALNFHELNSHTDPNEISGYLFPLRKGEAIGVMSEAGCPGVADPGAAVVKIAQAEGFRVVPLIGPSSILLSLMASGLNGQKFCFHGYLPIEDKKRSSTIRQLESESRRQNMTQLFIETPYRNQKLLECLLKVLNDETYLCIASNISHPKEEKIITRRVREWKRIGGEIEKVPTIFLIYGPNN